jgi:hypothetical protein
VFWALVAVFVVIACLFCVPQFRDLLSGSWLLLTPLIVFCLLGIALIVFTLWEKVGGRLKGSFLLAGASAAGFLIFVLLHNAFYALGVDFLEAAFLFMAVLVCPLGFLVGAIGSIVLLLKKSG